MAATMPGLDVDVHRVHVRDSIVRSGRVVIVTAYELAGLGDLILKWQSPERDADGLPVVSGVTHVRAGQTETVRLVGRPGRWGGGRRG